ncbi:hypothetical protein [Dyadobacter sp. CY326]|uniref:hypothetical protein n=1 Tax=Dyadobacter sp. CY326 TaxID=2907300 RepID=UPI001F467007|nr:hypothetical protein [Dyadobacter sp. CY326]MCE7068080.1 hypothetical protein [Dyadobacter sp. CY326]
MKKVLIIGKIPPPLGGVTVHVSRLVTALRESGFENFSFCNLQTEPFWSVFGKIVMHSVIHLHASNPFAQAVFALFCRMCGKKLILTYHGNWGRYSFSGNFAVNISAFLASIPIVQNPESFLCARKFNNHARLISTFIFSKDFVPLDAQTNAKLNDFRERYDHVFCTNAWKLVFDKLGNELYGISDIIRQIQKTDSAGLIISDPSASYSPFIERTFDSIPDNVLIIRGHHDFRNVLHVADAFIRNTSTDGVSLSIFEARELGVAILASDAVSRPEFCYVFGELANVDLIAALAEGKKRLENEIKCWQTDVVKQLVAVYSEYLFN